MAKEKPIHLVVNRTGAWQTYCGYEMNGRMAGSESSLVTTCKRCKDKYFNDRFTRKMGDQLRKMIEFYEQNPNMVDSKLQEFLDEIRKI